MSKSSGSLWVGRLQSSTKMRGALIEGLLNVISSTGRQLSRHGAAASESCTSSTNLGSLSTIQNAALIAVRQISNTAILGSKSKDGASETIDVTFKDEKDGSVKTVKVPLGTSLLEAAHENHIDLEGACEGSLACSTCHVIVEDAELYEKLPEPDDDENDMLDLAFGLTETSRLGCQIIASKELDGLEVKIPSATRNFAVDGYVPKPH